MSFALQHHHSTFSKGHMPTSRASMSRALWHNAEMQDGVKHFLAAHSQLSLGTLHHGGLWGCPLLYSTTIAPSQRATSRASMSRALWHNAEMQDGVKHFLAVCLQCVRNRRWYTSPWWSLGLPFGLQYHHSTFSKGPWGELP